MQVLCVSVMSSICGISLAGTERTGAGSADATPASAPVSTESKQKAMAHFETGLKLYEDGDFSLALIEFERAYSYVPDYRVLYNIGQVSIQLGRYARAAQALAQYLEVGGRGVPAPRVKSVREDLNMLEGRTARLKVTSNVEGAEVLLDDVRIAVTPFESSILVDAGEHRLTVQKAGYTTRGERVVLAGRDDSTLPIDLVEVPRAEAPTVAPAIVRVEPHHPRGPDANALQAAATRKQWLYIGAGATGLFAVGWAVTGYIGIKAAGDLHDALKRPSTQGELESLKSNARAALVASDILGGVALATGATTLYFALSGPSTDPKSDKRRASAPNTPRERPASSPTSGISELKVGLSHGALQLSGTFF